MSQRILQPIAVFIGLVVLAAAGAAFLTYYKRPTPTPSLAPLGTVEDFTLIERSGKPLTRSALLGKVWVADFIFTACGGPCPQLTRHFADFQKELAPLADVRLVSFSVNPDGDTPEILSQYAAKYGADPQRWLFLTGDKARLYHLIETSFKLVAQPNYDPAAPATEKFIHSTRLVLVDQTGTIRGYYDGLDPQTYPRLKADIGRLHKQP